MDLSLLTGNLDILEKIVVPLLIFFARICDVSLGTVQLIFITRGFRRLASVLGFFDILIYLFAITQIMRNLDDFTNYIAYGAGYATGTYVGMWLDEKISLGTVLIRVVTNKDASDLISRLKRENYGITTENAMGALGSVQIILTIVKRIHVPNVVSLIKQFNPQAFYTIEDVRFVAAGISPPSSNGFLKRQFRQLFTLKRGK
jgi:uncharacterized protein YebE (UPF0316 family)